MVGDLALLTFNLVVVSCAQQAFVCTCFDLEYVLCCVQLDVCHAFWETSEDGVKYASQLVQLHFCMFGRQVQESSYVHACTCLYAFHARNLVVPDPFSQTIRGARPP